MMAQFFRLKWIVAAMLIAFSVAHVAGCAGVIDQIRAASGASTQPTSADGILDAGGKVAVGATKGAITGNWSEFVVGVLGLASVTMNWVLSKSNKALAAKVPAPWDGKSDRRDAPT